MLWLRQLMIHIERWPVRLSTRDAVPDAAALAALGAVLAKAPARSPRSKATTLGPTFTLLDQEYAWHPLIGYVTQQLRSRTVAERSAILSGWLSWLANRKTKAETALTLAHVAPGVPASLKDQTLPKAPTGVDLHFTDPYLRLIAGRKNTYTTEPDGTDQALAALANQASAAANAAAGVDTSAALMQQIRNLADVYARWETAATIASRLVTTQLAKPALTAPELVTRLLAFFRAEGDLTVPPEADTLDATLQQVPLPPGRSFRKATVTPSYYTYCATVLMDQAKLAGLVGSRMTPVEVAEQLQAFVLAGMDILWNDLFQSEAEAYYPTTPPYSYSTLEDWWALNREGALGKKHDDAVTLALADRDKRLLLLTSVTTGPAGMLGSTYRVTPIGAAAYAGPTHTASGASVEYLAALLTEAAWYLDRLTYGPTRFGPGASTRLPEPIVYLLYHVGSEAPAMLCSAAQAAANPKAKSAAARALRTALQGNGYNRKVGAAMGALMSVRKTQAMAEKKAPYSKKQQACLTTNWPIVAPVLGNAAVLSALADYVTAADGKEWDDNFFTMRANVLGYRRMYEFLKPQVAP